MKTESHARPDSRGLVRIGVGAHHDDSSDAGRLGGSDNRAKVPRRVDGFHREPDATFWRPDVAYRKPLLPENGAQPLRLRREPKIAIELRRELRAGNARQAEPSCQFLSEWV